MDGDLALLKKKPEKLMRSSNIDIWKCNPCLVETQMIPVDSSPCTLSKHVAPLCEINDCLIISLEAALEAI